MNNERERELFEKHVKKPEGVYYNPNRNQYETSYNYLDCYPYQEKWEVWQARASIDSKDFDRWLSEHESLMHEVSKAAIVVGFSYMGEIRLHRAEEALMDHARSVKEI